MNNTYTLFPVLCGWMVLSQNHTTKDHLQTVFIQFFFMFSASGAVGSANRTEKTDFPYPL